jgi:hypothetical protein
MGKKLILFAVILILIVSMTGCAINQNIVKDGQNIVDDGKGGIYGIAEIVGGACVPDSENPEICRTGRPYTDIITLEIREYSITPKRTDSIVKSLDTGKDGSFEVDLLPGNYCIWAELECQALVKINSGERKEMNLVIALP